MFPESSTTSKLFVGMRSNTSLKSTLNSFIHVYSVSLCTFKAFAVADIVGFVGFSLGIGFCGVVFFAASIRVFTSSSRVSGFLASIPDILVHRTVVCCTFYLRGSGGGWFRDGVFAFLRCGCRLGVRGFAEGAWRG